LNLEKLAYFVSPQKGRRVSRLVIVLSKGNGKEGTINQWSHFIGRGFFAALRMKELFFFLFFIGTYLNPSLFIRVSSH